MIKNENVLVAALKERWDKYRAELKTCKTEFSETAIHDLRVATRRLLAVMELLRTLDPYARVQKVRRALKNQLDALDDLRDTQVMLVEVSESMANFPDLKRFEDYLLKREKKLLRAARKEIKGLQTSELKKRIVKCRALLEQTTTDRGWKQHLLSAVDQAYVRAGQAYGQIDASQAATIHRFRITFKKFRYMVEIVHPILKRPPESMLKQMHAYQSRMGDVQDAEVFLSQLAEFVEQDPSDTLTSAHAFFEHQRTERIENFMRARDELGSFWRATPKHKFPWEKSDEPVPHSSRNRSGGGTRIRKRQPAPADRQGQKENGEDRAGTEGIGDGT